MFHRESRKPLNFAVKRSKVKVTRQKQQLYVGLQTKRNIDACCVRQLRLVFPAAVAERRFFLAWSFSQQQKLPAWVVALL